MSMAKRVEGPPAAYRPVPVAGDRARHEVAVVMPTEHQSVGVWLPHAELRDAAQPYRRDFTVADPRALDAKHYRVDRGDL